MIILLNIEGRGYRESANCETRGETEYETSTDRSADWRSELRLTHMVETQLNIACGSLFLVIVLGKTLLTLTLQFFDTFQSEEIFQEN